jgi:hypothetical protein
MRRPNAARLDGQIDGQGTIRGQVSSTNCVNTLIWQKLPAPTAAFDGTYAGISRTSEAMEGQISGCVPNGPPPPLTIVNGLARTLWGRPASSLPRKREPRGLIDCRVGWPGYLSRV